MPKLPKVPYSEDKLQEALSAVRSGMPKKKAARIFSVPKATIQFRLSTQFKKVSPGPAPVLTTDEENTLAEWLMVSARKGQPRRSEDLKLSVKELLDKSNRPNPFTNNRPGDGWYKAFLRRHPQISLRTPEEVTRASACVSEADIRKWFTEIRTSLKEDCFEDVLNDPTRLFNCDETGFPLNPKNGKVMVAKGERNVYEVDKGPPKTNITVLYCFSASGSTVPPLIVYPYASRVPGEIKQSVADASGDWGIAHTESGWMSSEVFYEYVGKIFNDFVTVQGVRKPVVLFVDGHRTHLTYELSTLCNKLSIILIALYPNSTRILQPCDVGIFRPLKAAWKKESLNWYYDHPGEIISKVCFAPILKGVLNSITHKTMANAFKASGLYPFNPDSIDFTKCLGGTSCEKPPREVEQYLKKSDFISIIRSSSAAVDILSKKPENQAENILQKVNDAFSYRKPRASQDILCLVTRDTENDVPVDILAPISSETEPKSVDCSFSAAELLSLPSNLSSPSITLTNFSFGEDNGLNRDIVQASALPKLVSPVHPTWPEASASGIVQASTPPKAPVHPTTPDPSTSGIVQASTPPKAPVHPTTPDPSTSGIFEASTPLKTAPPVQPPDIMAVLNWPLTPKRKGKRKVARDPYVISSKKWQIKNNEELKEKEKLAIEKENRKLKREEKKQKKVEAQLEAKRRKLHKIVKRSRVVSESSNSSIEVSSGDSVLSEEELEEHNWEPPKRAEGEFVVVKYEYDEGLFPSKILKVGEKGVKVTSMEKCGRLWKWPKKPDILDYDWQAVVGHIDAPIKEMEAVVDDFLKEIEELKPSLDVVPIGDVPSVTLAPKIESLHNVQVPGTSWVSCYDQNTGCPYFWNHLTNQVCWQPPPEYIAAVRAARKRQETASIPALSQKATPGGVNLTRQQSPKQKTKYPWEASSDSEEEKIELITSFGPESGDESDEKEVRPNNDVDSAHARILAPRNTSEALKPASAVVGTNTRLTKKPGARSHMPKKKPASVIGPQLPAGVFPEAKPNTSDDVSEIYETSSLLTPLVPDQGPPGMENAMEYLPDSSTIVGEEKVRKHASKLMSQKEQFRSSPDTGSDLSDDEDILSRLKSKAKILENMGGEVPPEVKELLVPTPPVDIPKSNKVKRQVAAAKKSTPASTSFALIANYGDDSDSEEVQTPVKSVTEVKPLFPSVIASSEARPSRPGPVPTLFPIVSEDLENAELLNSEIGKPSTSISIIQDEPLISSELPDSTTHKAFQRKKRIEFDKPIKEPPSVRYSMDPTSNEHRGFGFSNAGIDHEGEKAFHRQNAGPIQFVKGEVIEFKPASSEKPTNSRNVASNDHKTEVKDNVRADDIEETAEVLKEKLIFLGEGKEEVSAVQQMAIQLDTLVTAWQQGALTPAYLSQWLSARSNELCENEKSAAPSGWTCAWDRERKRYFYKNNTTGNVLWDYPEISTEDDRTLLLVKNVQQPDAQEEIAMELSETPPRASSAPPTPEPPEREPSPPPPPSISLRRSDTPPPPPPPQISLLDRSAGSAPMEVTSSTCVPEPVNIPVLPTLIIDDEPLPPGVDDIEIELKPCPPPPSIAHGPPPPPPGHICRPPLPPPPPPPPPPPDSSEIRTSATIVSSSNGTSSPRKRSLLSELDSFYSDLAMLEAEPVSTTKPPLETVVSSEVTKQTLPGPSTSSPSLEEAMPAKKRKKGGKLATGLALKKKGFNRLVANWEKVQKEARESIDDEDVSSSV